MWIGFDWLAYPGVLDIESAPVVYVYASLLLFVWLFAGLNFHLGRLHISSIVVLLIIVVFGYMIIGVDHDYDVTREMASLKPLTPVDAAKGGKGGTNLVVVASAGGGIWAAGWTGLALEKLLGARPELAREIRLLSTVSGGSVGAANYARLRAGVGPALPMVRAGSGRAHYIGLRAPDADRMALAVCVVARGTDEGTELRIEHPFTVTTNRPIAVAICAICSFECVRGLSRS